MSCGETCGCHGCQRAELQERLFAFDELSRSIRLELDNSMGLRRLGKSLSRLTGDYFAQADHEDAERTFKDRLDDIAGQRLKTFEELCSICPDCQPCKNGHEI